jgi:hypothetical protein
MSPQKPRPRLYAIVPSHAPEVEAILILAYTDEEAMDYGVFVAAADLVSGSYGSPEARVYRIADAEPIGDAKAVDAPASWEWARGVHALVAELDRENAENVRKMRR